MSDPHAHDEGNEPRVSGPGPWGWPCPHCATENVLREEPGPGTRELCCDYCGAVSELSFGR